METFAFHISSLWISCLSRSYLSHQLEQKLVAKQEFNNTMDKHAVKVVKGDEKVGHLPRKFSRILWYFLACSGEISVEVIRLQTMQKNGGSMPVMNLTSQTKYK